ncbi:hypothetical protein GCM10009868_16260 [Terrabacter aerolatus]|uniref:PqqD family protein n=1 Tax=Terrabacter aerolatus TaxID=422442 RepID=A0A512D3P7_9MICO|nr:PqqD family protein [Terrabacter aerolatus]GEO31072.1 hypothetical protein TAE01_28820 [Terrabacter aerolatus]
MVWREVDGEIILLDLDSSRYLTTNGSGSFLLQRLTSDQDRDDLARALAERYDLDVERARADTDSFLRVLQERRLLA